MDIIPNAKIRKVIRVESHDLQRLRTSSRDFFQHRCKNPAGLAPRGQERHHYGLLRSQNFGAEVRLIDFNDLGFVNFHVFDWCASL